MNQEKEWPFARLSWWLCAIHASCSHGGQPMAQSAERLVGSNDVSLLEELANFYGDTLTVLSGGTLDAVNAANLLFRAKALKKWKFGPPSLASDRKQKALLGFRERNDAAAAAGPIPYPYSYWMREVLRAALPDPTGSGWEWTGRFGPGAVFEGFSHPLRFERLVEWCANEHWPEVPLHRDWVGDPVARLCAVPKDALKDRLITVESTYNSFVQQYVREALQVSVHLGRFRGTCMDLYDTDGQSIQRRLALQASRNGALATLDLSDASDRITWDQVQQVFPAWCCHLFDVSRSEYYQDPLLNGTEAIRLHIFAGMGNGSTFTVETLFFAAFVKAYALAHNLPRFVSVFGDDIICHSTTACALFKENFPFFKINHAKSFAGSSALREACGVFAYHGWDITAPKVDGFGFSLEGRMGLCDLHKRLRGLSPRFRYAGPLSGMIAGQGLLTNLCSPPLSFAAIDDNRFSRSQLPKVRFHTGLQEQQALFRPIQPVTSSYATDWRAAKCYNHPPPEVWYSAWLCGMLGRRDWEITSPAASRRLSITFPRKGQWKVGRRSWVNLDIGGLLTKPVAVPQS